MATSSHKNAWSEFDIGCLDHEDRHTHILTRQSRAINKELKNRCLNYDWSFTNNEPGSTDGCVCHMQFERHNYSPQLLRLMGTGPPSSSRHACSRDKTRKFVIMQKSKADESKTDESKADDHDKVMDFVMNNMVQ